MIIELTRPGIVTGVGEVYSNRIEAVRPVIEMQGEMK